MNARGIIWREIVSTCVLAILPRLMTAQTVPDSAKESGTAPLASYSKGPTDSLHIQLLRHGIDEARLKASQIDFWHRLLPEIRILASVGVQEVAFADLNSFAPSFLPKDAYRVSLTLSLNELFNFGKHDLAELEREKAQTEYAIALQQMREEAARRENRRHELDAALRVASEEVTLLEQMVTYTELLFQQDKAGYDRLQRTRLELLHARRSLSHLQFERQDPITFPGDR